MVRRLPRPHGTSFLPGILSLWRGAEAGNRNADLRAMQRILSPQATPSSPNTRLRKPSAAQYAELGPRWKGGYPAPPTQGSVSIFQFRHNHRGLFGGEGARE